MLAKIGIVPHPGNVGSRTGLATTKGLAESCITQGNHPSDGDSEGNGASEK